MRLVRWFPMLAAIQLVPAHPYAAQPVSIAVMEFSSKGGVTQDQMDALSEMLANEIRGLGDFKVLGKSDIALVLNMEERRQQLGTCTDQHCLAEVGGALGVRWVLAGSVSLFGRTYLLNLKLVDVAKVEVASGISRTIQGQQDQLVAKLPGAVRDLLKDLLGPKQAEASPAATTTSDQGAAANVRPEALLKEAQDHAESLRPAKRTGRWSLWAGAGACHIWGDTLPVAGEEYERLVIEEPRTGFAVHLAGGYHLTEWLLLSLSAGVYSVFGEFDDPGDGHTEMNRTAIDVALDAKFTWPTAYWIEPFGYLTAGFSYAWDEDRQASFAMRGPGFVVSLGLGADFYLSPTWYLGLRLGYELRNHPELDVEANNETYPIDTAGEYYGGNVLLTTGWLL